MLSGLLEFSEAVFEFERKPRRIGLVASLTAILVVGAMGWLAGTMTRPTASPSSEPLQLAIPQHIHNNPQSRMSDSFAVAHATGRVLFIAEDESGGSRSIYVRRLSDSTIQHLAGTEGASDVTVSPDGRSALFIWNDDESTREELRRISVDGGPVTTLLKSDTGQGFAIDRPPIWLSPTSVLVMSGNRLGLHQLSLETLETKPLVDVADLIDGAAFVLPNAVIADGRVILLSVAHIDDERGPAIDLFAVDLRESHAKRLVSNAYQAAVFDRGRRIAFIRGDALCVARFDAATSSVIGEFMPLYSPVEDFEISPEGTLYYTIETDNSSGGRPIAIDLNGDREILLERRTTMWRSVSVSPDGRSLGITVIDASSNGAPTAEILDIGTGFTNPIVPRPAVSSNPIWMNLDTVAFVNELSSAWREVHRFRIGIDQTGTPISPLGPEGGVQLHPAFSPDERWMVYQFSLASNAPTRSLWIAPIDSKGEPRVLVQSGNVDTDPAFSPDGRWLAYSSDSAGKYRVVMQQFDSDTGTVLPRIIPLSIGQGVNPVWSPDGSSLYFLDLQESNMKRIAIEYEPELRISTPEVILTTTQLEGLGMRFTIFPDGERFIFVEQPQSDETRMNYINITLNWLTELQSLMPLK